MSEQTELQAPECHHSLLADENYPTLCGTMLLYAGKIHPIPEDHDSEPLDDGAKVPRFL